MCLTNNECNRCKHASDGKHEVCDIWEDKPVCDIDEAVSGIQTSGDRKLAECVGCKKAGMFLHSNTGQFLYTSITEKNFLTFFILDGTSTGDGKTIGLCPSFYTNYRCVSTGHCNVCRLINGVAEGCEIRSTTPVCDMDESTSGIQNTASRKVAKCVACTKAGELPC